MTIPAMRGTITDRNGVVLALSESADDVIADPMLITRPTAQRPLHGSRRCSGSAQDKVLAALTKPTPATRRSPTTSRAATGRRIMKLGINGISPRRPSRRASTRAATRPPLRSSAGSARNGAGRWRPRVRVQPASWPASAACGKVVTDPHGQALQVDNVRTMVPGKTLRLTISAPLQAEVEQVLAGVGAQYQPVGATAIVADPQNGQILALANWPSVNPNDVGATAFCRDRGPGGRAVVRARFDLQGDHRRRRPAGRGGDAGHDVRCPARPRSRTAT